MRSFYKRIVQQSWMRTTWLQVQSRRHSQHPRRDRERINDRRRRQLSARPASRPSCGVCLDEGLLMSLIHRIDVDFHTQWQAASKRRSIAEFEFLWRNLASLFRMLFDQFRR